jgi:hypothetical protein
MVRAIIDIPNNGFFRRLHHDNKNVLCVWDRMSVHLPTTGRRKPRIVMVQGRHARRTELIRKM